MEIPKWCYGILKKIDSLGSLDCYGLKAKDHTEQICEPVFQGKFKKSLWQFPMDSIYSFSNLP